MSAQDSARPFLRANPALLAALEPVLHQRLEDMTAANSLADRVQAALLETLPSGRTGIGDVAPRMGMSTRSLQRKLQQTGTSY